MFFSGAAVRLPSVFDVSNKYMLVIDSILIAIVAVYGLNLLTGFTGLISIGHAAFVGVGAYTLATFARTLGSDHVLVTHYWPLMILLAGGVGAVFGAVVGLPSLRLNTLPCNCHAVVPDDFSTGRHQFSEYFLTQGQNDRHRPSILVYRQSGS